MKKGGRKAEQQGARIAISVRRMRSRLTQSRPDSLVQTPAFNAAFLAAFSPVRAKAEDAPFRSEKSALFDMALIGQT
jgi:hypothetical protein